MLCSTTTRSTRVRTELMPLAVVVTPNMPEAAQLLGGAIARGRGGDDRTGDALAQALGANAVLLKGGHATGPDSIDLFVDGEGRCGWKRRASPTKNTHGTGCTLSSAIAAELAKGASLREAVAAAKAYVTAAIAAADELEIGKGRGPVHHFHAVWPRK